MLLTPPRMVPNRDDYYMGMAFWASRKSKDPKTQVGAYIVGADNEPISSGYNGPPSGFDDNQIDWVRPHKGPLIHHAEDNAITFARGKNLTGATIYITGRPCSGCALDIARARIARVVFFPLVRDPGSLMNNESDQLLANDNFRRGNVRVEEFQGDLTWMLRDIEAMKEMGVFGERQVYKACQSTLTSPIPPVVPANPPASTSSAVRMIAARILSFVGMTQNHRSK